MATQDKFFKINKMRKKVTPLETAKKINGVLNAMQGGNYTTETFFQDYIRISDEMKSPAYVTSISKYLKDNKIITVHGNKVTLHPIYNIDDLKELMEKVLKNRNTKTKNQLPKIKETKQPYIPKSIVSKTIEKKIPIGVYVQNNPIDVLNEIDLKIVVDFIKSHPLAKVIDGKIYILI